MDKFLNLKFQEKRFLKHLKGFSEKNQKLLLRVYQTAKKYHSGQKRDEGGPYIIHCLRTASCLIGVLKTKEPEIICAALLHDAIEDTDLEMDEIIEKFGRRTGEIVGHLTRKKEGDTKQNKYQRKYQKFLRIMKLNDEARAIKACDWLDNIKSWPHIPKDHPARKKFERWSHEAEVMYIPLAQTVSSGLVDKMKKALVKAKENTK